MKTWTTIAMSIVLAGSTVTTAFAAPLNHLSLRSSPMVEKVWCRHGYCGDDGAGAVGGLIGGLVGGAIAAGAAQQQAQQEEQAAYQARMSSCAQRFRSYDPASGTYLRNGRRYPCP